MTEVADVEWHFEAQLYCSAVMQVKVVFPTFLDKSIAINDNDCQTSYYSLATDPFRKNPG